QIWSYRYAAAKPPAPPVRLQVTTEPEGATVTWTPLSEPAALLRGSGARSWEVEFEEIARVKAGEGRYHDTKLRPGTIYHYRLGVPSFRARTQPLPPEDVVVSMRADGKAEVSWKPSPEE